jgi:hypothetical protein
MPRPYRLSAALAMALIGSGCGYGQFQTAKTVEKGAYRITMAQQFQGNRDLETRGVTHLNFPPDLMVRVGVADRVDLGASIFLMGGLLVDAKINFFPHMDRFALALSAGVGGAADWGSLEDVSAVLHVPLRTIVSYRLGESSTPYFGFGYAFYWIFGRDDLDIPPPDDSETTLAGWKGHGDGLLMFTVGYEHMVNVRFGVILEYRFWLPVVDDPGDHYAFIANHLGGIGFVF